MTNLITALIAAVLSTNPAVAVSNAIVGATGISVNIPDRNDPVEKEYQKLLDEDDKAQEEIDEWIKSTASDTSTNSPINRATLRLKIQQRLEGVQKSYESFLKKYPDHTRARVAYASFLSDIGKEEESRQQLEIAKEKDPKNPAVWNNLANYYGHNGPVTNAFIHYEKAIELNPYEPIYYQNFATTVYMFRQDSMDFYKLTEEQVIEKAIGLYKKALELNPKDFLIASDLAQTYYGYKIPKPQESLSGENKAVQQLGDKAIAAWRVAEKLARDDIEREGVLIHIARWQINLARFDEARKTLNLVTNEMYETTKARLLRKLEENDPSVKNSSTNQPADTIKR